MQACPAQLMKGIVNHASDSAVCTDATGKTVWVNQRFADMSGYTLDDAVGRAPGSLLQGEDTAAPSMIAEMLNYRKDGAP